MRRRLFVALLAAGLLVVAGFAAAAVASGGSPFALLEGQSGTADETTTDQGTLDRTTTEKATSTESTEHESGENAAPDQKAQEKSTTDEDTSSQKVTICHHTGSTKHPFHPITVDEHAVSAHTGHGDTVGPCPATTSSAAPAAKHGKPKHSGGNAKGAGHSQRSEQGQKHGNGQPRRPEKHGRPNH